MFCKNCGAKLDKGATYCVSCLTRVTVNETANEPAPISSENSMKDNIIIVAVIAVGALLLFLL